MFVSTLLEIVGFVLVAIAAFLVSIPLGLAVSGAVLVLVGVFGDFS